MFWRTYQSAGAVDACVAGVDAVEPLGLAELPEALFRHGGGRNKGGDVGRKVVTEASWLVPLELGLWYRTDRTEGPLSFRTAGPLVVKRR